MHCFGECFSCLLISSCILKMFQLCLCLFLPSVQSNLFNLKSQQLPHCARQQDLSNQKLDFPPSCKYLRKGREVSRKTFSLIQCIFSVKFSFFSHFPLLSMVEVRKHCFSFYSFSIVNIYSTINYQVFHLCYLKIFAILYNIMYIIYSSGNYT